MTTPPPARVGDPAGAIDTPALVIDLDAFERNLDRMAAFARETGVRIRPHAKTHKSPAIARLQMERGAVGQCCQKVGEAEVLVDGGINDVLVSNQVVGAAKVARLAALAGRARIGVCADDPLQVDAYSAAAKKFGTTLYVLVEVDVGAARCGVAPGDAAVALAQRIAAADGLVFDGIQAYHGSAQHIRGYRERHAAIAKASDLVEATVDALAAAGLECRTIGGAGSGTFRFETGTGLWNELQPGSYCLMDADYGRNLKDDGSEGLEFEHALFIASTVMSAVVPGRAVVDAGLKASRGGQRSAGGLGSVRTPPMSPPPTSTASCRSAPERRRPGWATGLAGAGPCGSDRQPVRLVCRGARRAGERPCGVPVAVAARGALS